MPKPSVVGRRRDGTHRHTWHPTLSGLKDVFYSGRAGADEDWGSPVGRYVTAVIGSQNARLFQNLTDGTDSAPVRDLNPLPLFAEYVGAVVCITPAITMDDALGWVFLHTQSRHGILGEFFRWVPRDAAPVPLSSYWFAAGYSLDEATEMFSPTHDGPVPSNTELRALAAIRGYTLPLPCPNSSGPATAATTVHP